MAAFLAINALRNWQPALGGAEENPAPLTVEKVQVPEGGALASEFKVLAVVRRRAVQNQLGEDALFLLPEIRGGAPGELRRHVVGGLPLDRIEDAAANIVHADLRHLIAEPAR
jgi:hypothetical protein